MKQLSGVEVRDCAVRGGRTVTFGCQELSVGYGDLAVARNINLEVASGEVVALLGPNGAGKTTTLLTLVGDLQPLAGAVLWQGAATKAPLHRRARMGLAFVMEEKSIVAAMTTRDNLRVAGVRVEEALAIFPELAGRLRTRAGLLSGGEQQMLTVARALARRPVAIVVDELSQGLAPLVAERLASALRAYADAGGAVLVVEQNLARALSLSDRFYVLNAGELSLEGSCRAYVGRLAELEAHLLPV